MTIIGLQALASLGGHGARRFLGVECQYASKRSRSHRGNDPGRPRAKDYGTVASPTPKRVRHLRCLQSFESGDVQLQDPFSSQGCQDTHWGWVSIAGP